MDNIARRVPGMIVYLQDYLAQKKMHHPYDPAVGICLGPYGGPRWGAFSREAGTPAHV